MKDSEKVRYIVGKANAKKLSAPQQHTYLLAAIAEGLACLLEWEEAK